MITRTFSFPKIAFYGSRRVNLPEVEISLIKDYNDRYIFTASGTVWNSKHTDAVMCGQCLDEMDRFDMLHHDPIFQRIRRLWSLHHLTDMHAGTVRQEKALKDGGMQHAGYTSQCEYLKSVDLYEDNGYKYGSGWLYRPIPEDDLNEIKALLEDT